MVSNPDRHGGNGRGDGPVRIRLSALSKSFEHAVKGHVFAVRDVDLQVEPGELLTLLGPSGCGKTTTLRMIAGFESPSAGSVHIGDRDVTALRAGERNIGFVFQSYAIFPHLSVFENIAYGLRVQRRAEPEIRHAVDEVLQLVGLTGYGQQQPHQLSGGEQQRVALARAVVFRPRILLFDEPLSNLDARLRLQMRSEIRSLQKRLGITTVYVTHDQEEAMAISDRIAVMDRGQIAQVGSAQDLYHRPANEFVARFIGRVNLLQGALARSAAGDPVLHIDGVPVRIASGLDNAAVGDGVRVLVRPERLTLWPADRPGLAGVVRSRTFLGEKTEYEVEAGEMLLQATAFGAPSDARFAPGDAVALGFPPEGVHGVTS